MEVDVTVLGPTPILNGFLNKASLCMKMIIHTPNPQLQTKTTVKTDPIGPLDTRLTIMFTVMIVPMMKS